ncbi:MAG: alanine racemase [Firmicutes bacterium]|nr:alanine racemase [Bacillota bacterium]
MQFDNTKVLIDLDAISENFDHVCRRAGCAVMAVVKADAYGHGAVPIAKLLQNRAAFFGVSSMLEAQELRRSGIATPILILGHTPVAAFPAAVRDEIRPAIFRWEDALALSNEAVRQRKTAAFHFALDTGMSRIGFQVCQEDAQLCARIATLPGLRAEGLFSHFASADSADLTRARRQAALFRQFDDMLQSLGVHIPIRHLNNSAGIMNFGGQYEMVRSGIVTYGLYPSSEVDPHSLALRSAMCWVSSVTNLRLLPPGREISYGGTYVTTAPTLVATVPVGYADGYRRSLSNRFYVLIRGYRAPILGRVCMDQMMVDVSAVPGVAVGDRVTLVGTDGTETITMEQISAAADSFNYEFICGISRRVPRLYYRGGNQVASVHYLIGEDES